MEAEGHGPDIVEIQGTQVWRLSDCSQEKGEPQGVAEEKARRDVLQTAEAVISPRQKTRES
jgi:hypothetical protein